MGELPRLDTQPQIEQLDAVETSLPGVEMPSDIMPTPNLLGRIMNRVGEIKSSIGDSLSNARDVITDGLDNLTGQKVTAVLAAEAIAIGTTLGLAPGTGSAQTESQRGTSLRVQNSRSGHHSKKNPGVRLKLIGSRVVTEPDTDMPYTVEATTKKSVKGVTIKVLNGTSQTYKWKDNLKRGKKDDHDFTLNFPAVSHEALCSPYGVARPVTYEALKGKKQLFLRVARIEYPTPDDC